MRLKGPGGPGSKETKVGHRADISNLLDWYFRFVSRRGIHSSSGTRRKGRHDIDRLFEERFCISRI